MANVGSSAPVGSEQGWFLEVISGPLAGNRSYLKPGQVTHVGRQPGVGLACPDDLHISRVHFAIQWDNAVCCVQDLNSSNGTFVNGTRAQEAVLARNDLVTAGETTFALGFNEAAATPAIAQPVAASPVTTRDDRLLALLRNNFQPLYAVLDAARDSYVLALLLQSQAPYQSLYEGAKGASLADVAPYLVRLPGDSDLLGLLVSKGWGQSWGVFLKTPGEFEEVRRHLRHFMEVRHPDGEPVYFRFYDPRVLRLYLPDLSPDEARQFLGPIQCYLMEDEEPDQLLQFVNAGQGVSKTAIPLRTARQPGEKDSPETPQTHATL